jgi:EAL domain-containing protein (putative c-di-GMP-specific phosphodiesterase class I)
MRLSGYEVDYCLLHHDITHYIGKSARADKAVNSIVSFVSELGANAIADGVRSSNQAEALFECGCSYVAGPLAGRYMHPRYIRQPKDDAAN